MEYIHTCVENKMVYILKKIDKKNENHEIQNELLKNEFQDIKFDQMVD